MSLRVMFSIRHLAGLRTSLSSVLRCSILKPRRKVALTAGKFFMISRMSLITGDTSTDDRKIVFSSEANQCHKVGIIESLTSAISELISTLRTLIRAVHLMIIFTPFFLTASLSLWFKTLETTSYRLLAKSLEYTGPVGIKLGQWASTRRDLFPLRLCQELSRLQRRSVSHSWKETEKILISHYGEGYRDIFLDFSKEPLGSGCCAQVHKASIRGQADPESREQKEVAVKVLHPNIKVMFERDLSVMTSFVNAMNWIFPSMKYLSLEESLVEFSNLMNGQLNLLEEVLNLDRFHRNFTDRSESIVFPRPIMNLCRKDIIVETYEEGEHIGDYIESDRFDNDLRTRREIADIGVQMLLKMIFTDNLVHGDLHPGNILVRIDNSERRRHKLVILDPGIVSSLSKRDMRNFRSVFTAVVKGEGRVVGDLFLEHSQHRCTNREEFIAEMEQIVLEARSNQLSLAKLNVSELLTKVFNTLVKHRVKLEANYASVILAIMVLEGLGRTLDPQVDILKKAVPYLIRR